MKKAEDGPGMFVLQRAPHRPRSIEPKTTVCTWLRARDHDRLIQLAQAQDQSVSAFVRSLVLYRLSR